jgi:hypothetical protein
MSEPDPRNGWWSPAKTVINNGNQEKSEQQPLSSDNHSIPATCGHTTCKNCTMGLSELASKRLPSYWIDLGGGHAALLWRYYHDISFRVFRATSCSSLLRTFSMAECRHVRLLFADLYAVDEMCHEGIANKQRLGLQSVTLVTLMRPPGCRECSSKWSCWAGIADPIGPRIRQKWGQSTPSGSCVRHMDNACRKYAFNVA